MIGRASGLGPRASDPPARVSGTGHRAPSTVVILVLVVALSACTSLHTDIGTAPSPKQIWTPPAGVALPATTESPRELTLPPDFKPGMPITLAQVVDLALANNPATRLAWLNARAAEAQLGSAEAAWLPELDIDAFIGRSRTSRSNAAQTSFAPSLVLNYLLFDFGGRQAGVEGARQALITSNLLHNQTVQDVILRTEQAYYSYLDARALLAAEDATIKEREKSLDSADARHNSGVATIADVLQARTALSQARLNRESIQGNLHTIEGALATTMGLPATTRFDFGELPLDVPSGRVTEAVDALIQRAAAQRPDLAAARASAVRADVRIREIRSQFLPSFGLSSSLGHTSFSSGGSLNPYSIGVAMRWPVFTGFRNVFDVRQAQIEAEAAREDIRSLEQQVNLQVWTSYYSLQTATERLTTARDLLASAQQSVDVASSRYRAGVGGILDLLTAESALESARAQEVQARADWFLSVAQLAHDTGSLEPLK